MPNHKSAEKRDRQNERRRLRNRKVKGPMRTEIKNVRTAIAAGDAETAKAELPKAVRSLDRAADKGIIHRKKAARTIGRLTRQVAQLD